MIDAIKRDNPDITDEEAKEKLRVMMEEKLKRQSEQMKLFGEEKEEEEEEEEEKEEIEKDAGK